MDFKIKDGGAHTTNAIESLNATYRKLNRQRSVFPSDHPESNLLSTLEATKKWTMSFRDWGKSCVFVI
jgi:transposase-like protein